MISTTLRFGSLLVIMGCSALVGCTPTGDREPKAVFIIVDGIAADVIEKLDLPVLGDISKGGGFTRANVGGKKGTYTETPTISAVGYNSLRTGTWVNKHNVWDNDIADPNYHYRSIFCFAQQLPRNSIRRVTYSKRHAQTLFLL